MPLAPGMRTGAGRSLRAAIGAAGQAVARSPRLWLLGIVGFSVRGGLLLLTKVTVYLFFPLALAAMVLEAIRRGGPAALALAGRRVALAVGAAGLLFAGCTTTSPKSSASATEQRQSLNSAADATLGKLYQASPQSKDLVARAKGVLIFPDVLSGSFIVGAEHG